MPKALILGASRGLGLGLGAELVRRGGYYAEIDRKQQLEADHDAA